MHLSKSHLLILAALVIVLIGATGYSLYRVTALENTLNVQSAESTPPAPTTIMLYGTVKSLGEGSLVITNPNGNTTITVSSATSFVASTPISPEAYNDEIQQYNTKLAQLRAQNDEAGIQALTFPSGVTTQPISFSDLTVGDSLVVSCPAQQAGTCEATQVMKSQTLTTSTPPSVQ